MKPMEAFAEAQKATNDPDCLKKLIEIMIHHVLSKDPNRFVQISVMSDPPKVIALDATGQVWEYSESSSQWFSFENTRNPNG